MESEELCYRVFKNNAVAMLGSFVLRAFNFPIINQDLYRITY
jgi:hypothetical protein